MRKFFIALAAATVLAGGSAGAQPYGEPGPDFHHRHFDEDEWHRWQGWDQHADRRAEVEFTCSGRRAGELEHRFNDLVRQGRIDRQTFSQFHQDLVRLDRHASEVCASHDWPGILDVFQRFNDEERYVNTDAERNRQ